MKLFQAAIGPRRLIRALVSMPPIEVLSSLFQMPQNNADMGLAVDQLDRLTKCDPSRKFLGRLDLRRIGVFGHSLGGAVALSSAMKILFARPALI